MRRCLACATAFAGDSWRCPACGFEPEARPRVSFAPELAAADEGFEEEAFALLGDLEAGSFWFRARNRLVVSLLRRYFPDARSMLDVGCGTGFLLAGIRDQLPHLQLTGGELFASGLEIAERRLPGIPLYQMDARHVPFDAEFDVVGAFDVLEHVDDDVAAIGELARATRPGGGVIVSVPQHRWLWSADDDYARHCRRYDRRDLVAKLRRAGLEPVRVTSFVSLLLPAMAVSRRRRRRAAGAAYDPQAEHRQARAVSTVLERVLDAERVLIERGVSFPAGGSLVVVSRRR